MRSLSQFLKESPDTPPIGGARYGDSDAVAFTIYKYGAIWNHSMTHGENLWLIRDLADRYLEVTGDTIVAETTVNSVKTDIDVEGFEKLVAEYRDAKATGKHISERKFKPIFILGRLWPSNKLVSIWRDSYKEVSAEQFEALENFIRDKGFGDPREYKWNDAGAENALYTYEEAKSLAVNKKIKSNASYLDKYKDIVHLLNPEQKAILKKAQATVDIDTPFSKRHEIADKLGMTVAQLNSILIMESGKKAVRSSEKKFSFATFIALNPYGFWVSRDGEKVTVKDWGGHSDAAKTLLNDSTPIALATSKLQQKGWLRVATNSTSIFADTSEMLTLAKLSNEQRKFLIALREKTGKKIVLNSQELEESFGEYFTQYWLSPDGKLIKVDDHKQWVKENLEKRLEHDSANDTWTLSGREVSPYRIADRHKYIRVIRNSDVIGFSYFTSPNRVQLSTLKDFAIESGKKLYDYEKEKYLEST